MVILSWRVLGSVLRWAPRMDYSIANLGESDTSDEAVPGVADTERTGAPVLLGDKNKRTEFGAKLGSAAARRASGVCGGICILIRESGSSRRPLHLRAFCR